MVATLVLVVDLCMWCRLVCVQGAIIADLDRFVDIWAGLMMRGSSSLYSLEVFIVWAD